MEISLSKSSLHYGLDDSSWVTLTRPTGRFSLERVKLIKYEVINIELDIRTGACLFPVEKECVPV